MISFFLMIRMRNCRKKINKKKHKKTPKKQTNNKQRRWTNWTYAWNWTIKLFREHRLPIDPFNILFYIRLPNRPKFCTTYVNTKIYSQSAPAALDMRQKPLGCLEVASLHLRAKRYPCIVCMCYFFHHVYQNK